MDAPATIQRRHRVEWIGYITPMDLDTIHYLIRRRALPYDQVDAVRRDTAKYQMLRRADGFNTRIIGASWGLPKGHRYQWGPHRGSYVQEVLLDDLAQMKKSHDWAEFRDLDDPAEMNKQPVLPMHLLPATRRAIDRAMRHPPVGLVTRNIIRTRPKL